MTRKQEIRARCEELAKEKAKRIGFAAWYECGREAMTPEEAAEVSAFWETLPGSSCWAGAFMEWLRIGE